MTPAAAARRGDDGQHLLARVVDVDAAVCGEPLGDPPESLDRHRVVDAQDIAVATDPFDQLAPEAVAARVHRGGQRWREAPVLALGEERVRGCTDRGAVGEHRRVGPDLVALWARPDREVERQGRGVRVVGDRSELLIRQVLGQDVRAGDQLVTVGFALRPEARVGPDVGMCGHEGGQRRVEFGRACRFDELRSTPCGEGPPVDVRPLRRYRSGRQTRVVEVHLVPVQPADGRVRARIVRVGEERRRERQRRHDVDTSVLQIAGEMVEVRERGQRAIALPQRVGRSEQPAASGEPLGSGHRGRGDDDDRLARPGVGLVLDDVTSERKVRRKVDRAATVAAACGQLDRLSADQDRGRTDRGIDRHRSPRGQVQRGPDEWNGIGGRAVGLEQRHHLGECRRVGSVMLPGDVVVVALHAELRCTREQRLVVHGASSPRRSTIAAIGQPTQSGRFDSSYLTSYIALTSM